MRYFLRVSAVGITFFAGVMANAWGQTPRKEEPLAVQVKASIDRAVRFLRAKQHANGGWDEGVLANRFPGGISPLVVLSLLNAGLPPNDPTVAKGLDFVRKFEYGHIYGLSLQTMALAEAKLPQDRELLRRNVKLLADARYFENDKLQGWSYDVPRRSRSQDGSNTQYALLGLWAAKQAGIAVDREVWESIRDMYLRTQFESGGWCYSKHYGDTKLGGDLPSLTMTVAGVCGLLITGQELNERREELNPDGSAKNCGSYTENLPVAKGLKWIGKNLRYEEGVNTFYHLYGLERAGRLSGLRFFGSHDWYRGGCEYLVKNQQVDGSWGATTGNILNLWPNVSTGFALLFLSKGRTPVLMSKVVHGPWPRRDVETDWNNDRHDLKHLVQYVSNEVFQRKPLAWQTFDIMGAATAETKGAGLTDEQETAIVSDLLQSPILYLSGHKEPRFTDIEKKLIKRYVENGGFLFSEACCNRPEFDRGIKSLVDELWPGHELTPLDSTHPVWTSHHAIIPDAKTPYRLMGLNLGCKTVMIHSPQDFSCAWESNRFDQDGPTMFAFRLGANIVAYATALQLPLPRGTEIAVASNKVDFTPGKRNYFTIGQVFHRGDWQPAPRAMHNLLDHVNKVAGLDVSLRVHRVAVNDRAVVQHKFLYMHGRNEFSFPVDQLGNLRFNLETGGVLFADACCGQENFDKAFRRFARDLFPGQKLEPIPANDGLFAKGKAGEKLDDSVIKLRTEVRGPLRPLAPQLEGIKINERWVVIYSKYDLGCALERHQSPDCRGYAPESAMRIATAVVFYHLRP